MCIYPLSSEDYPNGIVNFVTGRISPDSVIVNESLSLGIEQMQHFEAGWPDSKQGRHHVNQHETDQTWVKRLL